MYNACQQMLFLGKGDNDRYQRGAQGGHGDDAGDDAGHGAGDRHADGAAGAALQTLRNEAGGEDGGTGKEAAQDGDHHRNKDSGTGIDFDDLPQNDEDGQRDKRQPDGAQKIPLIPADQADDKGEQDTGIFLMVHFEGKRLGLKGLPKDSIPHFFRLLAKRAGRMAATTMEA